MRERTRRILVRRNRRAVSRNPLAEIAESLVGEHSLMAEGQAHHAPAHPCRMLSITFHVLIPLRAISPINSAQAGIRPPGREREVPSDLLINRRAVRDTAFRRSASPDRNPTFIQPYPGEETRAATHLLARSQATDFANFWRERHSQASHAFDMASRSLSKSPRYYCDVLISRSPIRI